jgi:hypothetical protein
MRSILTRIGVLAALATIALPSGVANAASSTLLYKYSFDKATGTVDNLATGSPYSSVKLTLEGDWSDSGAGVLFSEDAKEPYSIATSGSGGGTSIDVPPTEAVGTETEMVYSSVGDSKCTTSHNDTPNVSQIGRDGSDSGGQVKLQESNCVPGATTYMECRVAGGSNASSNKLVDTSTLALKNGHIYEVSCIKLPDGSSGTTTEKITVTDVTAGGSPVTTPKSVPNSGTIETSAPVTAGNKEPSAETDQFNGVVNWNEYCDGASEAAVTQCLTANAGN